MYKSDDVTNSNRMLLVEYTYTKSKYNSVRILRPQYYNTATSEKIKTHTEVSSNTIRKIKT